MRFNVTSIDSATGEADSFICEFSDDISADVVARVMHERLVSITADSNGAPKIEVRHLEIATNGLFAAFILSEEDGYFGQVLTSGLIWPA
jgi:hypothetical protein